jgi:hypothetical protein
MMELLRRLLTCSAVAVAIQSSAASAQSPTTIAAGFGFGPTHSGSPNPTVVDMVAFADIQWPVMRAARAGVELWWAFNGEHICLVSPTYACRQSFPDYVGLSPTISTTIGQVLEVGFGPGVFERYYSSDEKSLVGGAVGHISATVIRSRYVNVLISARPFLGPATNGHLAWVVPVLLGLSR